ncbi:hypothetical protein JCM8547_000515 [Rhodosporidiobolus lusitaniae]
MCIVFWHVGLPSEEYSLIVASNRDEFLARPTTSVAWHNWAPASSPPSTQPTPENRVLSGLDLTAGGTWFGVSLPPPSASPAAKRPALRFATLTNFTEVIPPAKRPSRGNLTREFLDLDVSSPLQEGQAATSLEEYLEAVEGVKGEYAGFNLLVGEGSFPSSSSSSASSSASTSIPPSVRLAYISNRESQSPSFTKRARILDPWTSAREGKTVRGLSNATLEVEEGEEEWPKVKSGAEAVEETVRRGEREGWKGREGEEKLAEGLYRALSTPHPSPIAHRTHLRHTVLVRPLCLDPSLPLPAVPPPLPPPSSTSPSSEPFDPSVLPPETEEGKREGEAGVSWYGTRVQTLLLVRSDGTVVLRERDAYVLAEEGEAKGRPRWSGRERRFEFRI